MDFAAKRVTVMGLGRFGGGVGVTRFLAARGADVLVTDMLPDGQLAASVRQLDGLPLRWRLGGHVESDFTDTDLVVVNPAVDVRANRYLAAARAAGVPLTSEIRLLIRHLPNPAHVIGVTGTAGKSTTTAMIGHILRQTQQVKVWVGGNLGGSLLDRLGEISPIDWVVLELSSFMLEDMAGAGEKWSPAVAVVTNVMPNHLDRHDGMEAYIRAKQEILEHQRPHHVAVLGPDLPAGITPRHHRVIRARPAGQLGGAIRLLLPGAHNQLNAWMAIEACLAAEVSPRQSAGALADFPGLPHRLQFVAENRGVRFFNDSKATTPEAALLALGSFPAGVVHVILGGYDKHSDLTALAQQAARHAKGVYTVGVTGPTIAAAARATPGGQAIIEECGDLDTAMTRILPQTKNGDVVLLSPGCASWDQFENYEVRGAAFAQAVLRYAGAE